MGAAKTACWVVLLLVGDLFVARFPMAAEAQAATAPHLSSVSLAFAPQVVDTSSAPKAIVITNQSSSALFIFEVKASVDFAARHNCSRPLRRGQSCQVLVRFSPSFPGAEQGTVTILDSSGSSPHTIRVSGAGMVRAGEERAAQ
jgi:Protein of unknown function (DUF1573)